MYLYRFLNLLSIKTISRKNKAGVKPIQKPEEIEKFAKFGLHNPPNEKEVLFKSGRSFNVLEVTKDRGYTLIIMEEV